MSSWIPTYEQIPTSTMVPQHFDNYSSIDELFNIKDDPNIQNLMKIKEGILDILQSKTQIEYEEVLDYKNEEIDNFMENFKKILKDFKEKQDEIDSINEGYKKQIQMIHDNMKVIDAQIEFLKKLPKEYKGEDSMKEIIDKMNSYTNNIKDNEKIKKIKEDYLLKIKELQRE